VKWATSHRCVGILYDFFCLFQPNEIPIIEIKKMLLHGYMFTTPKYHGKGGNDHLYLEYGVYICLFNS
jgi:hypothetical protein